MRVQRIKSDIESSLSIGDSFEKIQEFLEGKKMIYDFDYHQKRFQARFDGAKKDSPPDNIAVYIYVNLDGSLKSVHVEEVFTSY